MAFGGSIDTDLLHDETFDLLCIMCEQKNRNREAEKYCIECGIYYCLSCTKVHKEVPSLKRHRILDKGSFPSRSIKARSHFHRTQPMRQTERCDRHSHHYIDMYCQNHDDVGCGTCMAVDHRLCKDIFYIPAFVQTSPSITSTKKIQQKLQSVSETITENHENFKRGKQHLLKRKAIILQKVKEFREEINERLDQLEKNTIADIEDKYNALIDETEKGMRILQTNKVSVTAAQDKLASSDNNPSQIFVNMKKVEHIAGKADKNAEENKPKIHAVDEEFEVDQRMSTLLREINVLGNVTQMKTMNAEPTDTSGDVQQKEALLQVQSSKKYYVKVQSDVNECNIVSACSLADGTILLSDQSNEKLKRVDSSTYTVIDYCDLPESPRQVCSINKHQAAVCLPDKQEVQFISLSNRMTLTNKITTDFYCCGLAYADGNLYISDFHTSVYIYSVSGKKLKQFGKDQSGQKLFSVICCLAVSEDGSTIYVVDNYNGLIILNSDGKFVGKFDGDQLEGAYDSYLTGRGSLLVCGMVSDNVLQFGLDGGLIGEVVIFGDEDACHKAICCNQQMSRMIIGRKDDVIEVYDL